MLRLGFRRLSALLFAGLLSSLGGLLLLCTLLFTRLLLGRLLLLRPLLSGLLLLRTLLLLRGPLLFLRSFL